MLQEVDLPDHEKHLLAFTVVLYYDLHKMYVVLTTFSEKDRRKSNGYPAVTNKHDIFIASVRRLIVRSIQSKSMRTVFAGNEIGITLKRQGHHAVLSVVNDGDEIPQDKLEHLFDRFYRVDEARNGEGQHYGLGLSIAKAVVEKHDGSISVSCQNGKIRFIVSIPIKK